MSIVLLHLMESHRLRLKIAYDHVRSYRMVAQPNEGFRFQLATTEVRDGYQREVGTAANHKLLFPSSVGCIVLVAIVN